MIRLAINGAMGKMGRRISALASHDPRLQVVAEIDVEGALRGGDALDNGAFDAVIDVSSDQGAQHAITLARKNLASLLIATTALARPTRQRIDEAAGEIAVMVAPNLSPGVAATKRLAALAAHILGAGYDISIVEHHHAQKKDAPSGTALSIAEAIARQTGRAVPGDHILSSRGGDVVGEHTIRLAGPGEYLEISHVAITRDLFAAGALRAIIWLASQKPGLYSIEQMLEMESATTEPPRHKGTLK